MTDPVTEQQIDQLWDAIAEVRDAHPRRHDDAPTDDIVTAILPFIAAEVQAAQAEVLTKRWVCQVARSGYHNGASCRPDDAHNGWGCDYYYEASIRATEYETGDRA